MHCVQHHPFFSRRRIERVEDFGGFEGTEYPTLDAFLWRPVAAGIWTHRDFQSMTFSDLCDAHEFLDVKEKNEADFREWQAAQERR